MSTDNWTTCPKCSADGIDSVTFREDYQFYNAESGTVKYHYRGRCMTCELECKFEDSVTFFRITPPRQQPQGIYSDCGG